MTLHGVRGNEVSFGDFHELIKKHLEKIDPSFEVISINMVYPKGTANFNAHASAADINKQLDAKIKELNPEDKISILAYSMGGQIGMTWYFDSLKDLTHKKYPEHVVNFFSLGAAYWGSKEASLGTNLDNLFGQKTPDNALLAKGLELVKNEIKNQFKDFGTDYNNKILPKALISFGELTNLSLTSDEIFENRLSNMAVPNKTKWISLSSLVNCFELDVTAVQAGCQSFQNQIFKNIQVDIFGKYTFGYTRRETDNSVITPAANARFIYGVENTSDYAAGAQTLSSQFRYSIPEAQQEFILAEGLHATLVPASMYERASDFFGKGGLSFKGMADDVVLVYKKDCENTQAGTCKHPAYKHILRELADCDSPASTCNQEQARLIIDPLFKNSANHDMDDQTALRSELHGFMLELNLRVPKGYDLKGINHQNLFKFIKVDFAEEDTHLVNNAYNTTYGILLARPDELGSLIINKVTHYSNQDQLRIAMTGLIVPETGSLYNYKDLEHGINLDFSVNLPGLKSRKIQAVVRPYYTTYTDLLMAK